MCTVAGTAFAVALLVAGASPLGASGGAVVTLTLSATIDPSGATTMSVSAPGCQPTPPERFPEIVVQSRDPATGAIGEGAVAVGGFTAPGVGSAVIPAGTPVNTFLVTVDCNGGALHGSQPFTLTAPAVPVGSQPNFTG